MQSHSPDPVKTVQVATRLSASKLISRNKHKYLNERNRIPLYRVTSRVGKGGRRGCLLGRAERVGGEIPSPNETLSFTECSSRNDVATPSADETDCRPRRKGRRGHPTVRVHESVCRAHCRARLCTLLLHTISQALALASRGPYVRNVYCWLVQHSW
jgi:hypothetical protein